MGPQVLTYYFDIFRLSTEMLNYFFEGEQPKFEMPTNSLNFDWFLKIYGNLVIFKMLIINTSMIYFEYKIPLFDLDQIISTSIEAVEQVRFLSR
jgi:hypothetical protein